MREHFWNWGRRIGQTLPGKWRRLREIGGSIFGRISWRPPAWLGRTAAATVQFHAARPLLSTAIILGFFFLSCASAWGWHWFQTRPKPKYVFITVDPIPVTTWTKGPLAYPSLLVNFDQSAARLEDLKKSSVEGVRLDPPHSGYWFWGTGSRLRFQPREDWPADKTFRIIFDKKFFPPHLALERLVYEAKTPPFAVAIKELQLYTDPTKPAERQITATLELTHAVAPGELDKRLRLETIGHSQLFPAGEAPRLGITYDEHQRRAYLRTPQVNLPEKEDFLKLIVDQGVPTKQGGARTAQPVEDKVRIPSLATMFRIDSIAGSVTPNKKNEPEQLVIINTSAEISSRELAKALEMRLLPNKPRPAETADGENQETGDEEMPRFRHRFAGNGEDDGDADEMAENDDYQGRAKKEHKQWKSLADVPNDVRAAAKKIDFSLVPDEKATSRVHAFRVNIESDGELLVHIANGIRALGNYPLVEDYDAVVPVPELPGEVAVEGEGGLLALNGERKLLIRSRGMPAIEYEIARVATSEINHLASQTEGRFAHPDFRAPWAFNHQNISRIALEHQSIALENKWKANFSSFDFAPHLTKPADGGSERGLFFLTARGWDPVNKRPIGFVRDRRFILVTDLGLLTKNNADGSHDIFVMSIKSGRPVANVTVEILGKNGLPLQTAVTDADGHCALATVDKSVREQRPVAYVARNGDDVAFMPYARRDRVLNFSRFDIDGIDNVLPDSLDAFVFTERGIYRPGDEIHIGVAVKQRNWRGNLKGLPVETEVRDARGLCVQTKKLTLPADAFFEFNYQTANESPSGLYTFSVYLAKDNKRTLLLGSASAQVKEFLPDRMKMESELTQKSAQGWISPKNVQAKIGLANLYGTPATDRRITSRIELMPSAFKFDAFKDYIFYDSLRDDHPDPSSQSVDLGEKKTDENGRTEIDLGLERFADATYALRFIVQGFEGEGGRSVTREEATLVSSLPYLIGCKPDGSVNYIEMNKTRMIDLVAVDAQLRRIAVENVTVHIIEHQYLSVLTKQDNGNYAYTSELQERTIKTEKISVAATGERYALPTNKPGQFIFELRDDNDRRLGRVSFAVAGRGTAPRSLEKNSELEVRLDRAKYNTGDEIAVSIKAPYAGSGLITIERDRVYATQWFHSDTAASIQHIKVPEGFEGSGYVNVAFVRALDAKEIFVSPLSYGVVPFTANMERRRLKIDLRAPDKIKPGEPLHINYKTDRPSRIVVFAVDEGILQVTDYKTPDPLGFFFRKCMLAVQTAQIVDLIIPEYSLLRHQSAFGGGSDLQRLNPFKRVTEKPVVFWSGIVAADTTEREVVYDVPDFFDGNLKVMAVAVAGDTTGSVDRNALVRGPFVITPSVPVLAAPGDEFEAGVTLANNLEGSGPDAQVELRAEPNEHLALVGPARQNLRVPEGRELSAVFRFRVNDKLGAGEIRFTAARNGTETGRRATLSVRPPVPYLTEVRSGKFKKTSEDVAVTHDFLPEFRKLNATVSAVPLGLAAGLDAYLKDFPHGCSEQITSGAFCRLLLSDEADFGLSRAEVTKQFDRVFSVLRRRQNSQGAFGYWALEMEREISFVSAYVMDFLIEAKAGGFAPSLEMSGHGLRYLQRMVTAEPRTLAEARTIAYAIYLLTREEVITTNYILNLQDHLEKKYPKEWKDDLTGVYLAGALHLLHKDAEAEKLIGQYRMGRKTGRLYDDFCQPLGSDAQFVAVLAREFPSRMKRISAEDFENILRPIGEGSFNTLSAAYATRALKAYSRAIAPTLPELSINEVYADKSEARIAGGAKLLQRQDFSAKTRAVRFRSTARLSGPGGFFQVVEAGFDRTLPNESMTSGLEVYREILGPGNRPVSETKLGEILHVRLHLRSIGQSCVTNVALVDLLPGGFEIVDTSLKGGARVAPNVDFVELREDRAVFFLAATANAREIDYQIKSCNRGQFVVPPVFAESMYNRDIKGRGLGGKITVTE